MENEQVTTEASIVSSTVTTEALSSAPHEPTGSVVVQSPPKSVSLKQLAPSLNPTLVLVQQLSGGELGVYQIGFQKLGKIGMKTRSHRTTGCPCLESNYISELERTVPGFDYHKGALVTEVNAGGRAAGFGLCPGDRVFPRDFGSVTDVKELFDSYTVELIVTRTLTLSTGNEATMDGSVVESTEPSKVSAEFLSRGESTGLPTIQEASDEDAVSVDVGQEPSESGLGVDQPVEAPRRLQKGDRVTINSNYTKDGSAVGENGTINDITPNGWYTVKFDSGKIVKVHGSKCFD